MLSRNATNSWKSSSGSSRSATVVTGAISRVQYAPARSQFPVWPTARITAWPWSVKRRRFSMPTARTRASICSRDIVARANDSPKYRM